MKTYKMKTYKITAPIFDVIGTVEVWIKAKDPREAYLLYCERRGDVCKPEIESFGYSADLSEIEIDEIS